MLTFLLPGGAGRLACEGPVEKKCRFIVQSGFCSGITRKCDRRARFES